MQRVQKWQPTLMHPIVWLYLFYFLNRRVAPDDSMEGVENVMHSRRNRRAATARQSYVTTKYCTSIEYTQCPSYAAATTYQVQWLLLFRRLPGIKHGKCSYTITPEAALGTDCCHTLLLLHKFSLRDHDDP